MGEWEVAKMCLVFWAIPQCKILSNTNNQSIQKIQETSYRVMQ